jgi:histone-lysine N-methyltransferase SETMAR
VTAKKIMDLCLECISHPAYSPDLAPSDYRVFGPLKETLSGKKFSTDDEIKEVVHRWLRSKSEEFFSRGIQALVKHWHTCTERGGDYVEKRRSVFNPICTYSVSKKILRLLFDPSSY